MAITQGKVVRIQIARSLGKVTVRNTILVKKEVPGSSPQDSGFVLVEKPIDHYFKLYDDRDVTMIDPTEMVKRTSLIAILQRPLSAQLDVVISHAAEEVATVRAVTLYGKE